MELLTGVVFLACWSVFGPRSVWLACSHGDVIKSMDKKPIADREAFLSGVQPREFEQGFG